MNLTPELLGAGAVGAIVILGAIGNYLRSLRQPPNRSLDPVLAGIGLAFGDKEQSERIIGLLERVARALEAMADRKQSDMQETLEEIAERLKPTRRPRARRPK